MRRLKLDTEEQQKKMDGSELQSGITPTKKEDLSELVLAKGMKSVLLWWRWGRVKDEG